jgi:O-acetyl-ADP-ribose deacetylase (regulator of RNase III)
LADIGTKVPSPATRVPIGIGVLRLTTADITTLEVEAFVFYARTDLALGSGFGNAIARRGGPSIKKALDAVGSIQPKEAVITTGGTLKAKFIVHAAGPQFQEPDLVARLRATIQNALNCAEANGIRQLALPAMGAGFYGIPLPLCATVMVDTLAERLSAGTSLSELIICANDRREHLAFERQLASLATQDG